jgi:hypothetical protein
MKTNGFIPFRGVLMALALSMLAVAGATAVRAAIPDPARVDPRFRLGYLVVTHYPGVRPDGTGDSTAGVQQALEDAFANDLVAFFPLGTYVISDTLKCVQWHGLKSDGVSLEPNPYKPKAYQLTGEHGPGGARALIRLVPSLQTAAKFADAARPRPLLLLRLYESQGYPNAERNEPADIMAAPAGWLNDTSYLFNCRLRNLDFDCGAQPGAIGVVWPAAQGALVEGVKVEATGAHAGFYGLPGRNWGAIDIEVTGGEYGIRHGYGAAQAANREVCAGVTIVGARLSGQTKRAIDYIDFVPLVLVGFSIVKDYAAPGASTQAPLAVNENTASAYNVLTLLDGAITLRNGAGRVAISNPGDGTSSGKTLYLRNVYVTGTTQLVQSTAGAGVSAADGSRWHRIDEYAYSDQRGRGEGFVAGTTYRSFATRSVLDGLIRTLAEPSTRLTPNADQPPADLISRHLPAGGFPYYEGTASPPAIVVTDAPYGAVTGEVGDAATAARNTAAIQKAIDAAAADPRWQGRVFIPKGVFSISGPLTLRANTKLFGAAKTNVSIIAAHASWQPTATPGILVQTVDDPLAVTFLGSLDLRVPDRNLYEHPFTYYHWRAGAGSATFDLRGECGVWLNRPRFDPAQTAPFVCTRFDGSAGGRHYFFGHIEQQFTSSSSPVAAGGYRTVVVDRTVQPLWFYGFNIEGGKTDRRTTDAEFNGAGNIVILGFKREGGAPMLRLRDCTNVALLGAGAMREKGSDRGGDAAAAYVDIGGACDRLLMANLLVQQTGGGVDGSTLREVSVNGGRVEISYPLGIALLRRGEIDFTAMSPGGASPGGPSPDTARLVNASARVRVAANDGPVVAGFVIAGAGSRVMLVRAVGPALAAFGVTGGLPDPTLRFYRDSVLTAENDDWSAPGATADAAAFAHAGAFALPAGSRDAALVATLGPGNYSAHAAGKSGAAGVLIVEVFDLGGDARARLVNLSTLNRAAIGADNPIIGFVVSGPGPRTVLLRAVGPTLASFGVVDFLPDPQLRIFTGERETGGNDNWRDAANAVQAAVFAVGAGAFPLPLESRDSGLLQTLAPGAYTLHLAGGAGRVLAEVYAP